MAKYEVFIPAAAPGEFNVTLKVDADNWMAGLKAGLKKLPNEKGTQVANIMVDIMEDNSIHVTDANTGRVFRIKELEEAAAAAPAPQAPAPAPAAKTLPEMPAFAPAPDANPETAQTVVGAPPPKPAAAPVAKAAPTPAPKVEPKPAPKPMPPPAKPVAKVEPKAAPVAAKPAPKAELKPAPKAAPAAEGSARSVEVVDRPSQPVTGHIGRSKTSLQLEDILADLFERTQDVYGRKREAGLAFLLDLALEKIPADAGSVFVADFADDTLKLSTARGPKAAELEKLKLRIPTGVGVVGFCSQEAVSLAISDTQKDPRFYREVSKKIGYETQSILCAPMVSGGRSFGCLEIINRKGTAHFTDAEVAILSYIAHQGAEYLERQ